MSQRLMIKKEFANKLRNPVPEGTLGDFVGVYNNYMWVHFDGTDEAQTVLPNEVINWFPEIK